MRKKAGASQERASSGSAVRAAAGFLAFFLGLNLLLMNAWALADTLVTRSGRTWLSDSFQPDYQNTDHFRGYISDTLETLLTMGVNGPVTGYYGDYDEQWYENGNAVTYSGTAQEYGYGWWDYEDDREPSAQRQAEYTRQAQAVHKEMQLDKNLLYRVSVGAKELYSNYDAGMAAQPEDYNFLLTYKNGTVTITKDGRQLDIYGNGYYNEDSQWYVPGYRNFTVDDAAKEVELTMAVLQQPQLFVQGNYQSRGYAQRNSQLYYLQKNLIQQRRQFQQNLVLLGVGAVLLLAAFPLRHDRRRVNRAIARVTGKVWFEGKAVLFLMVLLCLLPHSEYLTNVFEELHYAYSDMEGGLAAAFANEGGWLLQEYLRELSQHAASLVCIFWAFWLLLFNDWRYNRKTWRHGILGLLEARELNHPLQKRLSRTAGIVALAFGGLALVALWLFLLVANNYSAGPMWWLLVGICVAATALALWVLRRQRRVWTDLGALADQIAAVRAGSLDHPLMLSGDADLAGMADDLDHIQQGLHAAMEERTRSERMKVELVTNVSHDLKTPLTSIISYTELLEQEHLAPPAGEYVKVLSEKSQRLKAMVQDVFEVSKAASGQLPVRPKRLDFARLLRQTLADMDQAIQNSGLALRAALPDEAVFIVADSDRLYRVFQNLLGNALKYSLPGSRVYLSLAVEDNRAVAALRNTSAAELRPGADYTGRFVRGDESRSDGGSGLGLSIASSFTQACGGHLEITTQADLFTATVTFPLDGAV